MKILIIGDFHSKCNIPLKKIIKKHKTDLILSQGDYGGNEKIAKYFFKHLYGKEEDEIPIKVQKSMDKLEDTGVKTGLKVIKKLKQLKIPFLGIRGNWDPLPYTRDIGGKISLKDEKDSKKLNKLQNKNFKFIDFKLIKLKDFTIVGGGSSTYPGKINKKSLRKKDEKEKKQMIKEYKRREKKYNSLFSSAKKINKPILFLTHNCPYNTKLDKIKKGIQKGRHYGSFLEKQIIKKHKPDLVICGHMHENQGKDKIKKTTIINPGAVLDKRYTTIEFNEKTKQFQKIKFY